VYQAPSWFTRELRTFAPGAYGRYFPRYKKWMIVRDYFKRVAGFTEYIPELGKHFIVEDVLEDKNHRPISLEDEYKWAKVLRALRIMRNSRVNIRLADALRKVDEEEAARTMKLELENQDRARAWHKKVAQLATSKTFT
jgi:hypothetical protein